MKKKIVLLSIIISAVLVIVHGETSAGCSQTCVQAHRINPLTAVPPKCIGGKQIAVPGKCKDPLFESNKSCSADGTTTVTIFSVTCTLRTGGGSCICNQTAGTGVEVLKAACYYD